MPSDDIIRNPAAAEKATARKAEALRTGLESSMVPSGPRVSYRFELGVNDEKKRRNRDGGGAGVSGFWASYSRAICARV